VSVERESQHYYGALAWEEREFEGSTVEIVVPENDPEMRAFHVWFRWPDPFNILFPLGGGHDLLLYQAKFRGCIGKLEKGLRHEVLREVESIVHRLTGEGEALFERAWFFPKVFAMPEETFLFEIEGKFAIAATNINELLHQKQFTQRLRTWTNVRRVQGWLGYFWWEFYQDVMAHTTLCFCKNCGNILYGGHKDRQYCTQQENPLCFRKRTTERQRKARSK
jgi:hypothetical protein